MTLPAQDWFVVVFYAMYWVLRVIGCARRGRQPLLRGREWFFDVRVQDGFYDGPGKAILQQYWLRMMIPLAIDVPWAIWIVQRGSLFQLNYVILAVSCVIHVNHLLSVRIAEGQARPYAVPESTRPARRLALSLAPRRLRDYSSPRFERALALVSIGAIAWLTRYYFMSPSRPTPRVVFAVPLYMVYLQIGMLIIKRAVIGWPSPMAEDDADERMHAVEQRRRYYAKFWDWSRASAVSGLAIWPFFIALPAPTAERLMTIWLAGWVLLAVVATVLVEIKRKQIANLLARATPRPMPDLLAVDGASWPVCWEPSAPALMLRSTHGYSLNLGNTIAKYSAVYVAGFAVLLFVLMHMAP